MSEWKHGGRKWRVDSRWENGGWSGGEARMMPLVTQRKSRMFLSKLAGYVSRSLVFQLVDLLKMLFLLFVVGLVG